MARILVVEHNPATARYLTALLRRAGNSTTLVDNCIDAWRLCTQEIFDILMVDVVLPGVDGFVLAQKAMQSNPGLQVVFVTGFAGVTMDTPISAENGPATVVTRHFHLSEIAARIRYMMGLGGLPLKPFPSENPGNVIYADFGDGKPLPQQELTN